MGSSVLSPVQGSSLFVLSADSVIVDVVAAASGVVGTFVLLAASVSSVAAGVVEIAWPMIPDVDCIDCIHARLLDS